MAEPSKAHLAATKKTPRYVKGIKSFGIIYEIEKSYSLIGYNNSDWSMIEEEQVVMYSVWKLKSSLGHLRSRRP